MRMVNIEERDRIASCIGAGLSRRLCRGWIVLLNVFGRDGFGRCTQAGLSWAIYRGESLFITVFRRDGFRLCPGAGLIVVITVCGHYFSVAYIGASLYWLMCFWVELTWVL